MCTVQLWFLVSGLVAISSAAHQPETTIKPTTVGHGLIAISSAADQLETTIKHTTVGHGKHHHTHHHGDHTAKPPTITTRRPIYFQSRTCNSVSRKQPVERLYHDLYHKMLQNDRKRFLFGFIDSLVGQHSSSGHGGSNSFQNPSHSYTSLYNEAFLHGIPNYDHVESYIKTHINEECRREIMIWIEDLAKHHKTSPTTNATMTETGEHCTHLRDANHVISLLNAWERHNHFADVQKLYLEVALGFHALTETHGDEEREQDGLHGDDSVSDYKHVRSSLVRLSSYCRKIVFAWIEDDARKHTAAA